MHGASARRKPGRKGRLSKVKTRSKHVTEHRLSSTPARLPARGRRRLCLLCIIQVATCAFQPNRPMRCVRDAGSKTRAARPRMPSGFGGGLSARGRIAFAGMAAEIWVATTWALAGVAKLVDQASADGFDEDALRQDAGPGDGLVTDPANRRHGVAMRATSAVASGAESVGGSLCAEEVLSSGVKPGDVGRCQARQWQPEPGSLAAGGRGEQQYDCPALDNTM
jgi:hypothetical protein